MRTDYRGEVWQDEIKVVEVQGYSYAQVNAEIAHYAAVYAQDGPVIVKRFAKKPGKRWEQTS